MTFSLKSKDCAPTVTEESTTSLSFTVFGTPVPQGSTRAFIPKGWKRPIITAANAKTKPWKQEIAGVAFHAWGSSFPTENAVIVDARFYFDRPKSLKKAILLKTTKPDLDKLMRSLLDALTGVIYRDDSQVISAQIGKQFGSPARCEVRITVRGER